MVSVLIAPGIFALFEAVDSEALREAIERAGGRTVRYQVTVGAQAGGAITPGAMCEALKHASSGEFPPTNDPVALHLAERLAKTEAPAVGVPRPFRLGQPVPGPRGSTLWKHFYGREASSDAGEEILFVLQDGVIGYQRIACGDGLAVALLLEDVATFLRLAGHAWFGLSVTAGQPVPHCAGLTSDSQRVEKAEEDG